MMMIIIIITHNNNNNNNNHDDDDNNVAFYIIQVERKLDENSLIDMMKQAIIIKNSFRKLKFDAET